MYNINDCVVYGTNGVCQITDITEMNISGNNMKYYVLCPVFDNHSKLFVPTTNEKLTSSMHPLISEKEAKDILASTPEEMPWIENENERKDSFANILSSGNRTDLYRMLLCIYKHQDELKELGKKLYVIDERSMKTAEHLLFEELAHVLNIPYSKIYEAITPASDY